MNAVYERFGIRLGHVIAVEDYTRDGDAAQADVIVSPQSGHLNLELPTGIQPVRCGASGWYNVRKHSKSRGTELPMVISDHCDWKGLKESIIETGAREIWVTHGPADSLKKWGKSTGLSILELKEVWNA